MAICGPKLSLAGCIISAWGIVQLVSNISKVIMDFPGLKIVLHLIDSPGDDIVSLFFSVVNGNIFLDTQRSSCRRSECEGTWRVYIQGSLCHCNGRLI